MTATATDPSSSSRSRTASVLISDTTRNGPHCSSTCDITASDWMPVTRPTNRLRAELATPEVSGASADWDRAYIASSYPSMVLRPPSPTDAVSAPESIRRRTVSSLTPRKTAASRIRR